MRVLLRELSQGLYAFPEETIDPYMYFSKRLPSAIYSHDTALYLWGMHSVTPTVFHMTVKSGSNVSRIGKEEEGIVFHYIKKICST